MVLLDPGSVAGSPVVRTGLRWRGYRPMVKYVMYLLSASRGHPQCRHQESRVVEWGLEYSIFIENAAKSGIFCYEFPTTMKPIYYWNSLIYHNRLLLLHHIQAQSARGVVVNGPCEHSETRMDGSLSCRSYRHVLIKKKKSFFLS